MTAKAKYGTREPCIRSRYASMPTPNEYLNIKTDQ